MIAAVFINGCFSPELSDMSQVPSGVTLRGEGNEWFLSLPDHCEIAQPIKIEYRTEGCAEEITIQHHIELGKNSKLTLIDEYSGDAASTCYRIHTKMTQKQDSVSSLVCLKNGAKISNDTIHVILAEAGAECRTAGFYHVNQPNQQANYQLIVEHAAPHTASDMLFKGIAENKSRAAFTGKVHVHPHAQKIVAHQANHHLLLSADAEVFSKPELEIYADDVKCKHGSTTGQLDQDALFYLRARGVAEEDAKRLLIEGFKEEVLRRLGVPAFAGMTDRVRE